MICLRMGKTSKAKTLPGEFKVTTLENTLLSQQMVTSKWISVTISHFQCTVPSTWLTNRCMDPSTWLTHQLKKDVGCKVLQFINTMKIMKFLDYKTLWHINAIASSRERWIRAYISGHNMLVKNFCIKSISCDGP